MSYVITSGPALASVASDMSYLSLLNITDDPYLLATVIYNKPAKTKVVKFASDMSIMEDAVEVLNFLKTVVYQNGGQAVTMVNNDAIALAVVLKACSVTSNGTVKAALEGIDCVLNATVPTGTPGVYNTARFNMSMIYGVTADVLGKATSVSMVVTRT